MDAIPPSYKSATDRDAWSIIASYIPSSDLCATSLVCHRWHDLFMPLLWGDPASHFGTENDAVYVALTRFRRCLKYARLEVRSLTHTLHLPPALSEIYDGPRPDWLKEILEYLPCLQCLMVSKLPFFDHNAMIALTKEDSTLREYNIRLLLAESEPNATSAGLAGTLVRFPRLIYLDLSHTTPARDHSVLSCLSQMENLHVLKLRGLGLNDADAQFLANAIGTRVRFLDLRQNFLTDAAIRSILQVSFLPPDEPMQRIGIRSFGVSTQREPRAIHAGSLYKEFLRSPKLDDQYAKHLVQPKSSYHWIEDLPRTGITHLCIAENPITFEGVAGLLTSGRLHALDVGTVNTADVLNNTSLGHGKYPGAEKLVPILANVAGDALAMLRIHHAVITAEAPDKNSVSVAELLPELPSSREMIPPAELDAFQEIHELPAGEYYPVSELPDTSTKTPGSDTVIPVAMSSSSRYTDDPSSIPRRGSVFAPEVVVQPTDESYTAGQQQVQRMPQSQPGNRAPYLSESTLQVADETWSSIPARNNSPLPPEDPQARRIRELMSKRPRSQTLPLRNGKECLIPYLHPSHMPNLEVLVLTDVPSRIPAESSILESLIRFITACSNEALLATLQAGTDYSLPPGRARALAEQQRARALFRLRRIVLEIAPTDRTQRTSTWKAGAQASSTGDRDSEALWAAAADDFSFFDNMECGIPQNDRGKYFPMAALNEKISLMPEDEASTIASPRSRSSSSATIQKGARIIKPGLFPSSNVTSQSEIAQDIDLVSELAAFRRAKKTEYQNRVRELRGESLSSGIRTPVLPAVMTPQLAMAHFVEGHWKGEVKVVRNPKASQMRSGMVDMYGNYFEKGYLYP
ncbi:hypothetical protein N7539_007213 [Penicillium diatomitis]|uniref:F-box domain-containing protein n=1 Tax=Penicillium diatomitis TaxID=2819901 RepID=A0A9W9WUQ7_9EURO|nr:uncharacterized protein N7539_007213 [Penicillium diatomitis]KAJ5477069.1 hypothetical protein N7539_007213 [Penicillium diatomitis]